MKNKKQIDITSSPLLSNSRLPPNFQFYMLSTLFLPISFKNFISWSNGGHLKLWQEVEKKIENQ